MALVKRVGYISSFWFIFKGFFGVFLKTFGSDVSAHSAGFVVLDWPKEDAGGETGDVVASDKVFLFVTVDKDDDELVEQVPVRR